VSDIPQLRIDGVDDPEICAAVEAGARRTWLQRVRDRREQKIRHHTVQFLLLATSATAMGMVNLAPTPAVHLAGNLIGICGQPLWLWSTWKSGEWGICILALVFGALYAAGALTHFIH